MGLDPAEQRVFDALADQNRRAMIELLAGEEFLTIGALSQSFPISRQAVTKHLAILEDAGLVTITSQGRERHVRLRPAAMQTTSDWMSGIEARWDNRLDRLRKHLESSKNVG